MQLSSIFEIFKIKKIQISKASGLQNALKSAFRKRLPYCQTQNTERVN